MRRPYVANPARPVLVACACLLSAGCIDSIELDAPLTDPANSAIDAALVGEWKGQGGAGGYLVIRPFHIDGAPPGLMQFKEVMHARGGNSVIEHVARGYFTVGGVGACRYANICGRARALAEVAGRDHYERWARAVDRRWTVVRYQVRNDQLTIWRADEHALKEIIANGRVDKKDVKASLPRYLASNQAASDLFPESHKTTYLRASLPPAPTAFLVNLVPDDGVEDPHFLGMSFAGHVAVIATLVGVALGALWWLIIGDSLVFAPAERRRATDFPGVLLPETSVRPAPSARHAILCMVVVGLRGSLAATAGVALGLAALLAEWYAIATSTIHGGLIASVFRLFAVPRVVEEIKWFLALATAAGIILVALKAILARSGATAHKAPAASSRGRLLQRVALALLMLLMIATASMVMARARGTAVGWLRGETCCRGLPASYWVGELQSYAREIGYPTTEDDRFSGSNSSVYGFLDIMGHVTVLRKQIGKDAVPGLVAMLNDPHPSVRQAAVIALARIGPAAIEATPTLLERLDAETSQSIRRNIMDALDLIDPQAAKKLGAD
jgi:hypothetical protein